MSNNIMDHITIVIDKTFDYEKFKAFFMKYYIEKITEREIHDWLYPQIRVMHELKYVIFMPIDIKNKKIKTPYSERYARGRHKITPFDSLEMTFLFIVEPDKVQCRIIE